MKKKIVVVLLALCMTAAISLAGCNGGSGDQNQSDNSAANTTNSTNNATSSDTSNTTTNSSTNNSASPQQLSGDVTGQVGTLYATKWFTFTVNSLTTAASYDSITAASGNTLAIANVTITNTFGSPQPFGTFDWFVDDDSLTAYIWPDAPVNANMMPESYTLNDGDTVTYDVVIEMPANLASPFFMYKEVDENSNVSATFRIPIK